MGPKGLENLTLTRYTEDERNGVGGKYQKSTTWCRKKGINNGESIAESNEIYEAVESRHL